MTKIRMDADQKRYFCTLCSAGNITQAAQTLFISRQGLSKSMKALEQQLNTQLFVRGKQGVELTRTGRVLLRYLREEDKLWDACLDEIRAIDETTPESIRIGLLSMYVGYDEKRMLLADFQSDPRIRIEIVDGDHDAYWDAIAARNMEFAFSISPPKSVDLPSIKLTQDNLSILVSCDNPLAQLPFVDFERDLRGKTVIQTSPYKGRLYETTFRNYGIKSEAILHDSALMLARVSTSEECFIIQTQYAKVLVTDQVCMRPLINAPIEMDAAFVFRPDLSPAAQFVARKLLEPYGKEQEFDAFFEGALVDATE
ncbi:MAG: LysR family transcriptional regulator [Raoultibacter sp.]